VAEGHPLALELLTAKLVTQGKRSILKLCKKWRSNTVDTLNDEFLSILCDYVFDHPFLEHIGPAGAELLSVIACCPLLMEARYRRIEMFQVNSKQSRVRASGSASVRNTARSACRSILFSFCC
jgi:hypothetical protein